MLPAGTHEWLDIGSDAPDRVNQTLRGYEQRKKYKQSIKAAAILPRHRQTTTIG